MDKGLLDSLDTSAEARAIADRAFVSRSEWYRRLAKDGVRAPMATLARLRIERAAYRLVRAEQSISEIGVKAGFAYTSAFSRAFVRAYGISPRAYRAKAPTEWRIPPLGGIHYGPGGGVLSSRQGKSTMKLIEVWIADHVRAAETLLTAADALTCEQLDAPTAARSPFPWETRHRSLRGMLAWCAGFAEPWVHLLDGQPRSTNDGTLPSRLGQLY